MKKNKPTALIKKASGETEQFSLEKYRRSLQRAGASAKEIERITQTIVPQLYQGITTKELYAKTFAELKERTPTCASRYSLKQALRLMGPSGFPFEQLVARVMEHQGYTVKTDLNMQGKCVTHEIDALLTHKDKSQILVECKFHNRYGLKSDVQTSLYVKARFDDVNAVQKKPLAGCMLVTNTKFTPDAIQYGECAGLTLLAWGYPHKKGLETAIEQYALYPITVLTQLKPYERSTLFKAQIVLCKDLIAKHNTASLGIPKKRLAVIAQECAQLCT